jgi:hypothetical protein
VARWNGSDRLTHRASSELLNVTILASDLFNAGSPALGLHPRP